MAMVFLRLLALLCLFLATSACSQESPPPLRESFSLAGEWQVKLDPQNLGFEERWFASKISADVIQLPNTTDLAGIGYKLDEDSMSYPVEFVDSVWPGRAATKRLDESGHLVRDPMYVGKAWYQREIVVPENWREKLIQLHLERVMWQSQIWLDDEFIGSYDSLATPHEFEFESINPGTHRLTICVDNGIIHDIGIIGHAYGPETQTRWNGIVGNIELNATPLIRLTNLRVFPPANGMPLKAEVRVEGPSKGLVKGKLVFKVWDETKSYVLAQQSIGVQVEGGSGTRMGGVFVLSLNMTSQLLSWDEFTPNRYILEATLRGKEVHDQLQTRFGIRELEREGRRILVNGQPVFLRGTLDCAVYPRTGHPPTSVMEWQQNLQEIKNHGFNHVRFHTWCPPEAAFEAADRIGMYLCPETAFWVDNWTSEIGLKPQLLGGDEAITDYVRQEIARISATYGNHPSFAFFCIGNEFGLDSDWETVQELVAEVKKYDPRHLYNGTTARKHVAADDFWVTHRTDQSVRGTGPPHTDWDHADAISTTELPVVSHETGQHPVFPDYPNLLPKFTGPLRPHNYQRLWNELKAAGLDDQIADFEIASARFQMVQYKAEHEGMLRTPHLAGYQLLMLNDFTGQSEALVGILDPFLQSKGVVSKGELLQWNSPTVPLARFERYVWTSAEIFHADLQVRHHGRNVIAPTDATWSLYSADHQFHVQETISNDEIPLGGITQLGDISVALDSITQATALTLKVEVGKSSNQWKIWVYPPGSTANSDDAAAAAKNDVVIATSWNPQVQQTLADGGKVLLMGHGLKNPATKQTNFGSVYWSAGWWGDAFSHLGILCQSDHPALSEFPNDGHSDWQWHDLCNNATTFKLENTPANFRPIVQLVPDFHHNQLLGQLIECKVGAGKLMICGYDLTTDLPNRHAARQFRHSLLWYMQGDSFQPKAEFDSALLDQLLSAAN
jgi:beta-galactosidase